MPRHLIVNADDFGRTPAINAGIIRAHEHGILTSASLMTRYPSSADAGEYAQSHPALSVGLHLDLGEYLYDAECYDWKLLYQVVPYDDFAAVSRELNQQLDVFRRLTRVDPTHLDSHQHVHRKGPALELLTDLSQRLGIPLRHVTPGIHYCGLFHGESYDGLDASDDVSVSSLLRILESLPEGVSELACHPGLRDDALPGGYSHHRPRELETLCDPVIREALKRFDITLRSFRALTCR